MTDFTLRPLTVPERKYTYAQSSQLQGQTGNIGYLRGDFGSSGNQFYTTWFDTRPQWKSDEFKRVPFPVSWTVKMKKKQKETQDILSYHTQAAGCSDKARAKASGGRQPIEECGRTGL